MWSEQALARYEKSLGLLYSRAMPHADFHRKVIHAIALVMFVMCSFLVVGTLAVSQTTPLADKFYGMDVPLQYQRALVVVQGAFGLVGALLMLSFHSTAWWILMITGVLGVIQGLTSVPAFLPIFLNVIYVVYLYSVKPLYFTASPAAPKR